MKAAHSIAPALAAALVLALAGCMTQRHIIGEGPSPTATEQTATQWYALWGLVPLNEVETKTMAGGATNYEIVTEMSPIDAVINFFTTFVSIVRTSVTVVR